mmetsp:Transcript_24663/g.63191  ORF Transcript_24663/g.63191 Transcript_24663/m.63191 type:complete len:240 (+) Transcript_24663:119-838(+)
MDAPMGSLAEDAGSSLSAAPGQAEPPAPAADPERVANQALLPTSIPNPDTVRVCSYGDHCRVAVVGGPQLSSCGEPGCINSLHHLCQGEYEAKFSELFANCDMRKLCLPCLKKQAKDNGPLPPPGDGAGGAPSDADIAASSLLASAVSQSAPSPARPLPQSRPLAPPTRPTPAPLAPAPTEATPGPDNGEGSRQGACPLLPQRQHHRSYKTRMAALWQTGSCSWMSSIPGPSGRTCSAL